MKENPMPPFELNPNQRRIYIDAAQLHEAYMDAFLKSRAFRGGMHWKKAKGKQYLFRSLDRFGHGKSLGARSPQTEAIHHHFHSQKKQIHDRLKGLKERLKEQARFCKAARIGRAPTIVTAILRCLEQHQRLGRNLCIIGTNALYAYEMRAGVFLEPGLMATRDIDLLWDTRPQLRLFAIDTIDKQGLIDILKKADRSFDLVSKDSFRAVNQSGYIVDLVKSEPRSILQSENRRMGAGNDFLAAEIKNLDWLLSAPKLKQIIIGVDGFPALMVAPDPRVFAVHKLWVGAQIDREPIKKERDRAQALAVCNLVLRYMPEFEFKKLELRMFPREIVVQALQAFEESKMPPGYD